VVESMGLAITTVIADVTMVRIAVFVKRLAKYVANIPSVHRGATSPVLRALSLVHGPASIKAIARCLARPRVAAYHATSDAPSFSRAVISVRASAVKHVQSITVKIVA